ncbi:hypothetical protein DSO57_1033817 [Entomophthora muscae]|uniref:Uncharacterized protein n=1 Tax=Entomophthora muscae TaxID=34485 RepID=A0ACC2TBY3_9FUNG|nr:hypothetical protein DSO57_1033817 [Entomophthora muscae]
MSNTSNYFGISNKTDACQMVVQTSEEDFRRFCGLSKEAKVMLVRELCQAETGSLWSGLESLTYSRSLNEGDRTREEMRGFQWRERQKSTNLQKGRSVLVKKGRGPPVHNLDP